MGVIVKVLYRGEDLKKPQHRNLFLDMEENIHIHYRDLRIELSRHEFEDIVHTFGLQSAELMEIIEQTNYQDGLLPNANHEDTRIWTDSRLESEVVYHPRRISLEECTDGFHLHLRNYKILLDDDDFRALLKAFRSIDLDAPYASTMDEIVELLEANDVDFVVAKPSGGKGKSVGRITVADYHEVKIRGVLTGIGMERTVEKGVHAYSKGKLRVDVTMSNDRELFANKVGGAERPVMPLIEFLARDGASDPDLLNALKTKVLDTFAFARKSGAAANINLDFRSWIYDVHTHEIIFPFDSVPRKDDPKTLYRAWSSFLKDHDLFFVKPSKAVIRKDRQTELHDQVIDKIMTEVATIPAVSKIHIMGSVTRGQMGIYRSPFIHSEWAKLGSDVDLLIEMDESVPFDVPEAWHYINVSTTNQCHIYHIGQVEAEDRFRFREKYPHIDYFDHLLDAYVYFPSKGDVGKKDAFLDKFKAKVIFDRTPESAANPVQEALEQEFGQPVEQLAKLDVPTENDLYGALVRGEDAILKVYKVSGNYSSSRLAEHAAYEYALIKAVENGGVATAAVIETTGGNGVFEVEGHPAILFHRLEGQEVVENDYPTRESAEALARFHAVQMESPVDLSQDFSFDGVFDLWRVEFHRFAGEVTHDEELTAAFKALEGTYDDLEQIYKTVTGRKDIAWVHNHGDVQPRNVIMKDGTAQLFDFQNAFFGPRLFDLVEGGIEFSWGFKHAKFNNFNHFDRFVEGYVEHSPLSEAEHACLNDAIRILGLIKFIKEVRMIKGATNPDNLRRLRALDLARFMESRLGSVTET